MTTIELINLTLNEIRRSAQKVADISTSNAMILNIQTSDAVKDILAKSVEEDAEALKRCRIALREVLEDIASYQNFCNAVEGVGAALGKVAYDLIYERTTDEDYEPNRQTE